MSYRVKLSTKTSISNRERKNTLNITHQISTPMEHYSALRSFLCKSDECFREMHIFPTVLSFTAWWLLAMLEGLEMHTVTKGTVLCNSSQTKFK